MEIRNLSDAEFKTLVIRVLKELSEYFNSVKKSQAEMRDILTEMNNLQRNTIEGMKTRINSVIWNIKKQKTTNQKNKKEKGSKKVRRV